MGKLRIELDLADVVEVLNKLGLTAEIVDDEAEDPKPGKGKKPDDDFDLGEPEKPAKGKKALAIEDVIEALRAYAEANSRDAAKKIVAGFKVKSVHDLKESDYAKVIAKLK